MPDRFRDPAWRRRGTSQRVRIFGECGGYMVLGEGLVAADGKRYGMLGLSCHSRPVLLNASGIWATGGSLPLAMPVFLMVR